MQYNFKNCDMDLLVLRVLRQLSTIPGTVLGTLYARVHQWYCTVIVVLFSQETLQVHVTVPGT